MAFAPSDPAPALRALLGPRGYDDDPLAMAPWLSDWRGRIHGAARAILSPASTAEVQAVVRLVAAAGGTLTLQGGNSGQCAGATPDAAGAGFILSLRRMNRIRRLDIDARLLSADAGVILQTAQDAATAAGLRFPLTLGGKGSATLGGLVATNAGGTQVLRHGTMRALTAGLEVVLADGSLLDVMIPLAKDNQGPDPKAPFIGGEGVFGIVTGVTLRLTPAPIDRSVAWVGVRSPADALTMLRRLDSAAANALEGFELMQAAAIDHVVAHCPGTRNPLSAAAPWHVLIETVTFAPDDPGLSIEEVLAKGLADGLLIDVVVSHNEAQASAFWRLRDTISEAERAIGPALQHDVSVPVDRVPAFLAGTPDAIAAAFSGTTTLAFGHLGDGNIHFHVRPPQQAGGAADALAWIDQFGPAVSAAVYRDALALGGSISAEHGIGRTKRALFGALGDPVRLTMLRAMKAALDPGRLLNPGVLIPD